MHQRGIVVSTNIFCSLLQDCILKKDMITGRAVLHLVMKCGLELNTMLGSYLVRLFAICGSLVEANHVFMRLPDPNVFAWSVMISAHAKLGQAEQAIELYHQMQWSGVKPDQYVFVAVLQACSSMSNVTQGKVIHAHIVVHDFVSDVFIGSTLVHMYAKCGSVHDAQRVFDKLRKRNLVTWNTMIITYARHGHCQKAFKLFERMQDNGLKPDNVTFVSILKACSGMGGLDEGKLIHEHINVSAFKFDTVVCNTLIDMYVKCASLESACEVFYSLPKKTVVTWNAMIAGYVQSRHSQGALVLFQQMLDEGIEPDSVTFITLLKACSSTSCPNHGKLIHMYITRSSFELDLFVGNTLIDMYAKCGSLEDAHSVFNKLPQLDAVSWNAIIAGYVQSGHYEKALQIYQQMQQDKIQPDSVTFISLLKSCSRLAALDQGKLIHVHIVESGWEFCTSIGNTLIDMYAKSGSLDDAWKSFFQLQSRDVVTWNAIIAGYTHHSNYKLALKCFGDMQQQGLQPNDVTFVSLLSACSHIGMVEEGHHHFQSMINNHGIKPTAEHYSCLADLLGRAGWLIEAEKLLQSMPFVQRDIVSWTSLLMHCKMHGDVELGRRCFNRVVELDYNDGLGFVLMASIYSDAGQLNDSCRIERLRTSMDAWKKPGKAFIEVDKIVHGFVVGDESHHLIDNIYLKLKGLSGQMMEENYIPHSELMYL